ncbi:hypothetical protein CEUSTIGMA_g10623.t1 [Chlamydomonas eustigma]|uniref:DNA mismatch repair protein MutS-like N-terminal domain-containing protein n=1 Tax=Chlamydomonas eustigma TaxID=1157962 RepID=A0A250XJE7_9CHLO|nr:hypothetical protein CEUSTIGMA_g10623.t1 [Chlamydomonas eustigma]|eukprot:GAX83197.1 hypothetical protein CEUSTIGMA_g10623.t1 [Chlamydomonas eustigma]
MALQVVRIVKKKELRSSTAEGPHKLPEGNNEVPPSKGHKSSQGQKRKLKPQVTSRRRRVVLSDEEKDEKEEKQEQESGSDYIAGTCPFHHRVPFNFAAEDDVDLSMDTSGEEVSDLEQENSDEDDDDHKMGKAVATRKKRGAISAAHLTPSPLPERVGGTSLAAAAASPLPAQSGWGTAIPELVHGIHTNVNSMSGEASCFLARMAQRCPFLHPDKIMGAKKRRPGQEDYDPGTLYTPPSWFKVNKVSEGQQQWCWQFKAANFDSVLLFKMGKFYEMFEMDAYVGVDVLGLIFMKGEQPHAGFPEVRYHYMAETLTRAELKSKNQKQCGVVRREKMAVLSRGTLIDAEMVQSRPDASYILAVCEQVLPTPRNVELLACTSNSSTESGS